MKKIKTLKGILLILCMICVVVSSIQPVQAKKFNKTTAKKNISVTYKTAPNGILAIYKNKNKTAVKLSSTMNFLDADKKSISKEKQVNYCLGGKSTGTFFFVAPMDESGNTLKYTSFKCSFSIAKSSYKSYSKKISVSSDLKVISGNFAAINMSGKTISTIHATIAFYDSTNHLVLCRPKNLNCFQANSIDQFTIDYPDQINQPAKAVVYIDWAY